MSVIVTDDPQLLAALDALPPRSAFSNPQLRLHTLLASSARMINSQSATGKVYRGHITFGPANPERPEIRSFVAVATYGRGGSGDGDGSQFTIVGSSHYLAHVAQMINDKLYAKHRRGYEQEGAPWDMPHISEADARRNAIKLLEASA